jgi:hypothetical protein
VSAPEFGQEKAAAGLEGDAVRVEMPGRVPGQMADHAALRRDDRNATGAGPVGGEQRPGTVRQHAFRPDQTTAQEAQIGEVQHGCLAIDPIRNRRIRKGIPNRTR